MEIFCMNNIFTIHVILEEMEGIVVSFLLGCNLLRRPREIKQNVSFVLSYLFFSLIIIKSVAVSHKYLLVFPHSLDLEVLLAYLLLYDCRDYHCRHCPFLNCCRSLVLDRASEVMIPNHYPIPAALSP